MVSLQTRQQGTLWVDFSHSLRICQQPYIPAPEWLRLCEFRESLTDLISLAAGGPKACPRYLALCEVHESHATPI